LEAAPEPRTPRRIAPGRAVSVAVLVGLTALLAVTAYRYIFSTFDTPDDEGYLIVTLRSFAEGNALYDSVYSQYGPGFYTLVGGAMKLLGIAFTSDGARWVNLTLWIGSTLLVGLILQRLTRNLAIAATGLGLGFLVLVSDASEPLHPGATIGLLLLALVAVLAFSFERSPTASLAVVGGLVALLASTNVNVGVLAALSVLFAFVVTSRQIASIRWLRAVVTGAFVAVPFVLMSSHIDNDKVLLLAATVAGGALALVLATASSERDERPGWRDFRWFACSAVGVLAVVCLVPIILGTSPGGLIDGWLIQPLGHPETAFNEVVLGTPGLVWTALGLVAATAWLSASSRALPRWAELILGITRIAIGVGIWITLASAILGAPGNLPRVIAFATPFAWIAAITPHDEPPGRRFVRVAIPALAVLQTLHAYPVPGAQLAWGTLLFVIVGGICVADGAAALPAPPAVRARAAVIVASLVALGFGTWLALDRLRPLGDQAAAIYRASVPLDLSGATRQRVDLPRAENLRALTAGIERSCDTFLTLPGLDSLYIYTGQTPPEEMSSSWMLYLDDAQQQRIIDLVQGRPRLCAVIKPDLLDFWRVYAPRAEIPDRPLVRFIEDDFRVIHDYSGYELAVYAQ
jgi:hypothetical protein